MVNFFGSDAEAARVIGVSKTAVKLWKDGKNRITGERAIQFERITNGHVTRNDFRPDLFGNPD